jgi:glutaredoxin-related protein
MTTKIVVYGTLECPDTVVLKQRLEKELIPYEFVDILASLKNLKAFLNLRDTNAELFADTVKNGGIGIPLVSIGDKVSGKLIKDFEDFDSNSDFKITTDGHG